MLVPESPEICLACNGVNKDPETHGYCENCRVKCRICGNYLDEDTEGENYENENCGCCYVEAGIIPEWMGHSYYANDYLKDFSPKVLEEYGYDNPCDCGDEDNCEHCSYAEYTGGEYVLVKFEHRSGEFEDYDSVIMAKEEANKYGDDVLKNHAHIVDTQYYLTQDEEWKYEEHTPVKHYKEWFDVSWGDGVARVRSVEPISVEDVKVLRKWGVA
jgi:hypothetical protein